MLKINAITLALFALLGPVRAWADVESFDTHFMVGGLKGEKISDYQIDSDKPMPGDYEMDVYLNNEWRGHYEITVPEDIDQTCLTREQIENIGIKLDKLSLDKSVECVPLNTVVQGGSVAFDTGQFILNLSVPQIYVVEYEKGYMPPETWDRGINAFYSSYYASQYYSHYKEGGEDKSSYASFISGLNLLGWQLHSSLNFTKSEDESGKWKSNTLYLERGIPEILGNLQAGDIYTGSDIFDSVRFRGVRLARDMQMLPHSRQNFAPVVRGIAQSNALVTVEQNGFVVYQKEVPPGPFEIEDLQLAGGGADLDVSIKEADGSVSRYVVPYSTVPNMLQPGVVKYDFSAGRSDIEGASEQADFLQSTLQVGVNNLFSLYGGAMLADDYHAWTLGSAWNTIIGAVSIDGTRSRSKQDNGDLFEGESYQVAWNKYFPHSSTHFSLAAYRYSSRNYRTFNDYVWANNKNEYHHDDDIYDIADYYRDDFGRKNSFTLNVNQALPEGWGQLAISGLWRDYWGRSGTGKDYQISYSNTLGRVSYTLSASQTYDSDNQEDKRFNLYFSVPLSWRDNSDIARRDMHLSNSTTFDEGGYESNNTSLTGTFGSRDQYNFNANLSHSQQNRETTAGGGLTWLAPLATLNGSYSQSNKYQQASANIQGGVVAWSDGVALTNRLSDTLAIIKAPGLEDAAVQGHQYLRTDARGYAIYDSLTPYRENFLTLDLSQSESEVGLRGNRQGTVPYRGAVVMAEFETDRRKLAWLQARRADGEPLTFGYEVEDLNGNNIGLVGQGSQIFIRSDEVPAALRIATDKQQGQFCTITLDKQIDDNKTYTCR